MEESCSFWRYISRLHTLPLCIVHKYKSFSQSLAPLLPLCTLKVLIVLQSQELGGISIAMERQKATLHELMTVVKDMLRNTEVAVRSFKILRPRFLHQNKASAAGVTAPSQPTGATAAQTSSSQPAGNSLVPVFDFYSGLPKKPSPFLHQTIVRFEKYLFECQQCVERLEQLLLLDSEKQSFNSSSSLLQSLPKVMANVHDFFVHVAAKVMRSLTLFFATSEYHMPLFLLPP